MQKISTLSYTFSCSVVAALDLQRETGPSSARTIFVVFVHVWLLLSCDKFIERKETAIKPRGSKL